MLSTFDSCTHSPIHHINYIFALIVVVIVLVAVVIVVTVGVAVVVLSVSVAKSMKPMFKSIPICKILIYSLKNKKGNYGGV